MECLPKHQPPPGLITPVLQRCPNGFTVKAADYVLGLDDGKKRFFDVVLAMNKARSLCSTLDEAKPLQKRDRVFVGGESGDYQADDNRQKFSQSEKIRYSVKSSITPLLRPGVDDVFALAGLDKPNIGLLSDEFLEEVRELPQRNLAVELLEKLLNDGIHARTKKRGARKKYSDRLKAVLLKYNRAIETAQVIEEPIQMAKEFPGSDGA